MRALAGGGSGSQHRYRYVQVQHVGLSEKVAGAAVYR
jgi:hypothetical protein